MKVAGSSVEVGLSPVCGPDDILTGTRYADEVRSDIFDYPERNNRLNRVLYGSEAKKFMESRDAPPSIGPRKWQNMINGIQESTRVNVQDYRFHTHIATSRIEHIYENTDTTSSDYFKFTICRNPWDHVVSYFWWSFIESEYLHYDENNNPISASKHSEFSKNGKYSYMMPQEGDSAKVLRQKLQSFLITESTFYHETVDRDINILDWFSSFSNNFYTEDIDYTIRFESLQRGFDSVCDQIGIEKSTLPRLKSAPRKSRLPYWEYYNSFTRDLVADKFSKIIDIYDYKFNKK